MGIPQDVYHLFVTDNSVKINTKYQQMEFNLDL